MPEYDDEYDDHMDYLERTEPGELKVTLIIDRYNQRNINGLIVSTVRETISKQVDEAVREKVDSAIKMQIESITTDAIEARLLEEIERCLLEGWTKTDSWGRPKGNPVSLKDRLTGILEDKGEILTKEVIHKQIAPELKIFSQKLKDSLKGFVDDALKSKIVDAIKVALQV